MIIKNGCASLRAIEKEDFDLLYHMINDPGIERMIGGWCLPVSRHEQEKWMESFRNTDKNIKLMIELENGKTIGMVMLTNIDWKNRVALLEYKIGVPAEYRMKGDIYDAADGILSYAFNELGLNCITATIMEGNAFSIKLIKKLGFVQEGIMRQRIYKNGEYKDQIEYSLLKREYYDLRNRKKENL